MRQVINSRFGLFGHESNPYVVCEHKGKHYLLHKDGSITEYVDGPTYFEKFISQGDWKELNPFEFYFTEHFGKIDTEFLPPTIETVIGWVARTERGDEEALETLRQFLIATLEVSGKECMVEVGTTVLRKYISELYEDA